jgi:hypothetical protein
VANYCTLNPNSWHSYHELHELYGRVERVEFADQLLSRTELAMALRTVPGFRAEKRDDVYGCYGLLLDERAPKDHIAKVFNQLGVALAGKEFEPRDVSRLAHDNTDIASALTEGGCMKPNPRTIRDWLMACRDMRDGGYVLRRTFTDRDHVWRFWRFERTT